MARTVTVSLVDDLTGTHADETVLFGVDGKSYEIDLSHGNAVRLREIFAGYIAAGRKRNGGSKAVSSAAAARSTEDKNRNKAIRKWASENGIELPHQGRIPIRVLEKYYAYTLLS